MKEEPVIAGIGEILWDVLPSGKQLGGAPCNFAFHAMQAGCKSYVISATGKDESGIELKQMLHRLDISTRYVQENEFPTSTVTVELNKTGHPDYLIHENVAWDHIRWNSDLLELAKEVDAVCFGSLAQRSSESEDSIKSFLKALNPGCLKVFDINLRQNYFSKEKIISSIMLSDILKLNEDELTVVAGYLGFRGSSGKQIDQLIRHFNLKYLVYTMGSRGSIIKSTDEFSQVVVPVIQVADTVGAGDSFTAVFIAGILKGISLKEIHTKASEISAYVCTQKGATPKLLQKIF
jgi:fructokinase